MGQRRGILTLFRQYVPDRFVAFSHIEFGIIAVERRQRMLIALLSRLITPGSIFQGEVQVLVLLHHEGSHHKPGPAPHFLRSARQQFMDMGKVVLPEIVVDNRMVLQVHVLLRLQPFVKLQLTGEVLLVQRIGLIFQQRIGATGILSMQDARIFRRL
jgi:hypothetical protein